MDSNAFRVSAQQLVIPVQEDEKESLPGSESMDAGGLCHPKLDPRQVLAQDIRKIVLGHLRAIVWRVAKAGLVCAPTATLMDLVPGSLTDLGVEVTECAEFVPVPL